MRVLHERNPEFLTEVVNHQTSNDKNMFRYKYKRYVFEEMMKSFYSCVFGFGETLYYFGAILKSNYFIL